MAVGYHFGAKPISRGAGQSAVHTAAYNSRSQLTNEREDKLTKDYSDRGGLIFEGVFAPKDAPDWTHDRAQLWNRAEAAENRKDAQTARNLSVALPAELTDEQREWVVKDFARHLTRQGMVADVAIHAPDEKGDERNYHAHILVTTRRLDGDDFAATKAREWNSKETLAEWRGQFAEMAGRALDRAGFKEEAERWRHGHETLAKQKEAAEARGDLAYAEECSRAATRHKGPTVTAMERRGVEIDRPEMADAKEAASLRAEIKGIEAELKAAEAKEHARPVPLYEALEGRKFILARASPDDAKDYEALRQIVVGDDLGKAVPKLKEGQLVGVSQAGRVVFLNEKTTGLPSDVLKSELATVAEDQSLPDVRLAAATNRLSQNLKGQEKENQKAERAEERAERAAEWDSKREEYEHAAEKLGRIKEDMAQPDGGVSLSGGGARLLDAGFDMVAQAADLLIGAFNPAPSRKISPQELAASKEARDELRSQREAQAEERKALDRMAKQVEADKPVEMTDLAKLGREKLEDLRERGDAALRDMLRQREEELERQRQQFGLGR